MQPVPAAALQRRSRALPGLDGNIAGACAYNSYDPADGSYSAISSINNTVVSAGVHTPYMTFYCTSGTTMYTDTNHYSIHKP